MKKKNLINALVGMIMIILFMIPFIYVEKSRGEHPIVCWENQVIFVNEIDRKAIVKFSFDNGKTQYVKLDPFDYVLVVVTKDDKRGIRNLDTEWWTILPCTGKKTETIKFISTTGKGYRLIAPPTKYYCEERK